jgi:hypothetical protein
MNRLLITAAALLLGACAAGPQPYCINPDLTREKMGSVPTSDPRANEEYARCKEREAEAKVDAELREREARGKQAEAEQLERERREMGAPDQQ